MLLGNKCKGANRDLNYKGNKTAWHLLLDTIAVGLLLCSISDTLRSWQSLCCCCCQKVLMATRNHHQPSVAHSWEHGCTNKFMIVSFGRHDRPARLGWGFRLVFTNKTKTDINVLTVQKLILILLKRPYLASTSLIVDSGDHVGKGFPPLFCSFALSKCYLLMNPYFF